MGGLLGGLPSLDKDFSEENRNTPEGQSEFLNSQDAESTRPHPEHDSLVLKKISV